MTEYWYLWPVLAVLIIVTAVVIVFAGRALSSHNEETKKLLAEIDRLKALKDKYKNLTPELIDNSDSKQLLEGITAVLQARIEKAENAEAEFERFNRSQKYLYTLNYFVEDVKEGLSFFFKNNGSELTELIVSALENVGADKIVDLVKSECSMYDENNEDVSIDYALIEEKDRLFSEAYSENELLESIKIYVKSNVEEF